MRTNAIESMKIAKLLGTEHDDSTSFGQYTLEEIDQHAATAIAVGGKQGCHPYTDLNEDSALLINSDEFRLAAVADAHYGARAGVEVINVIEQYSPELFSKLSVDFTTLNFREWLNLRIYPVSREIHLDNVTLPLNRKSRTQLSLVIDNGEKMIYAQFGDTRITSSWETNGTHQVAPVIKKVIGYPMKRHEFNEILEVNHLNWKGDAIFIYSDGFPEAKHPEYDVNTVASWAGSYESAKDICRNFMEKAFAYDACDNLSIVALLHRDD